MVLASDRITSYSARSAFANEIWVTLASSWGLAIVA